MAKTSKSPKHPPNHLKAWRLKANLTQEQLAEAVGTTKSVISEIEGQKKGLSGKWLRKLAPALGITQGLLLEHDPDTHRAGVLEVWEGIPEKDRDRALQVLRAFSTKAA